MGRLEGTASCREGHPPQDRAPRPSRFGHFPLAREPMLSVVIPCRNEAHTGHTIRSILHTARVPVEVILVEDECGGHQDLPSDTRLQVLHHPRAEGVDRARHAGILAAGYPGILVMDAHMTCEPGWDRTILNHLEHRPDGVSCCQCPTLDDDLRMDPGDRGYIGARIELIHEDPNYFGWSVFQPKWTDGAAAAIASGLPSRIGCILGASYSFLRQRYLDIGAPWGMLWGWGWSEALLCLANWCLGGESWVLPCRIGHLFRTGQFDRVPYSTLVTRILHNQMLLIESLPMSQALRLELRAHFDIGRRRGFYPAGTYADAEQMRRNVTGDRLAGVLKHATRNLDDYRLLWP